VAAWALWTESGQKAVGAVSDLFGNLKETFGQTWGGIVNALKAGDLALASEIAFAGVQVAWEEILLAMAKVWDQWSQSIVNSFTDAMRAVLDAWQSATNAIASWLIKNSAAREQGRANAMNRELIEGATRRMTSGENALARVRGGETLSEAEQKEFGGGSESDLERFIADQAAQITSITGEKFAVMKMGAAAIDQQLTATASGFNRFLDAMDEVSEAAERKSPRLDAAKAELGQLNDDAFWGAVVTEMEKAGKDKAKEKANEVDVAAAGGIQAMKDGAKGSGSSIGSFSAAALLASGGRGGIAQQQLMVAKEHVKIEKAMLKIDEAMIKAIEKKSIQVID
jgi:hypothetical protein